MEIPAYLAHIYAKSPSKGGETLYEHTWHVVSRFAEQARLRPTVPAITSNPRLWHQLFWAALLHDFGKVAVGFQHMLATNGKEHWQYRHEVGSLAFVPWLFPDSASDDYRWVVAAIVSHHKDASTIQQQYPDGGSAIRVIAGELASQPLDNLWRWLDEYSLDWQTQLGLEELGIEQPALMPQSQAVQLVREQGTIQIEQALRTYRRFVKDLEKPTFRAQATTSVVLRGMIITADHSASAHTGSPPTLPIVDYTEIVKRLGWSIDTLYEHQRESTKANGDALLIAPTGSGKTESALFWAFGQSARQLPRLFYALPFQASMNTMRLRLEQVFPGQVGLQHSRAVQALYRAYIEDGEEPYVATMHAKMQKNRTELNYFPIRVFSPYQMLKACYRIRGYEAILSDFLGASFIFDEIHAYEAKRLALILSLIGHLKQHYDARFFIMSATFPNIIKGILQQTLGTPVEIEAAPKLFEDFQRHRLHLLPGDMQDFNNTAQILNDARKGISVLVCCNTVDRAQTMWRTISAALGSQATVVLLHSRLNGRDRLKRETRVRNACGVGSDQRQAIVLVATQVVEVSLNIDLDTIYSDLAPLEALIQRFGRVNRTRRKDSDNNPIIVPVHVFQEPIPEKTMRPYDLRLLRGVLRLLSEQNGNVVDESAVGRWLNTIYEEYTENYAASWHEEYVEHAKDFQQSVLNPLVAFNQDKDLERLFYAAFDSIDVLPNRFEQEYFDLMRDGRYIDADSLLVSIPYWQYCNLTRQGKAREGDRKADDPMERVTIVNAQYNDDLGLLFNTSASEEG